MIKSLPNFPTLLLPAVWWQSPALKQSLILTLANGVGAAMMAAALILAARIMGPESFGRFSLMSSLLIILTKGADLGLHQLIPRLYNRYHDQNQLKVSLTSWLVRVKLLLTGLMILLSLLATPLWQVWFGLENPTLVYLAIFGAAAMSWYELAYLALSAQHQFSSVAWLTIAQAAFKIIGFGVISFMVLWWWGRESGQSSEVLTFFSLVYAASALVVAFWLNPIKDWWKRGRAKKTRQRLRSLLPTDPRITLAAKIYWPHAAVGTLSLVLIQNLDLVLVLSKLSSFETGIYAGAVRVSLFVSVITYGIGSVLNNRITRYQEPAQVLAYLKKSLLFSAFALIGFVSFLPLATPIITYTIGPAYLSGLMPFIVLVGSAFLGLALAPYASFFFHLRSAWPNSLGGVGQLAVLIVINLLFLEQYGLMAAALARLAATGFFGLLVVLLVWRSSKRQFGDVGGG